MNEELSEEIFNAINSTVLYGTIISDAYTFGEREKISDALKKVCDKQSLYSFDCCGVYFYWDYYTKEILYIGLTNNLTRRFNEHNGILEKKRGNKYQKIKKYFTEKEKIVFSVLVQSPMEEMSLYSPSKDEEVAIIEGSFIEGHKLKYNSKPIWNDIGGSKNGRSSINLKRYAIKIFDSISLKKINDFNAKSTLREIANSDEVLKNESNLHAIRMLMYKYGDSFETAKKILLTPNPFFSQSSLVIAELEKLLESVYMNKKLVI